MPSDRFFFEGFLPQKEGARRERIAELKNIPGTLVFFESPRRLADMLADLALALGERQAAVARELTKMFENVRRGTLGELAQAYAQEGPPKGEIVVLVAPSSGEEKPAEPQAIDALLLEALKSLSVRDAAANVAARTGQKRRDLYARAIELASPGRAVDDAS